MSVATGDLLPGLAVTDATGRSASLAALRGEATLIIFLRHLG
jgi:hypothetical protein